MPDRASRSESVGRGAVEGRRVPRLAWAVVLLGFALRLGVMGLLGDSTGFRQAETAARGPEWDWGYEQGAVAQAIAEGRGFSDPFAKGSGATGWAAPAYPYLVAALIELFGGLSFPLALTLGVVQAAGSALVSLLLWRLGRDVHSDRAGGLAALGWALHPMAAYLPVALVWDSTFVALALTWFLARLAEVGPGAGTPAIARLGAAFGVVLLVNPAPLSLLPLVLFYFARQRSPRDGAKAAAAFVLATALVVAPWSLRNLAALGSPNLRTNLGVELFVGNNDGAGGPFNGRLHPAYNDAEYARYVELGEVAYSAECRDRALDWVAAHPKAFVLLTLERIQRFWLGPRPWTPLLLGSGEIRERDVQGWIKWAVHAIVGALGLLGAVLWRGNAHGALLVRGAMLLYPLVYYGTHVLERYRFPIEPLLVLAAAGLAVNVLERRSRARAR